MKVAGRDVATFCARPGRTLPGALIHGADAMRVALRREDLVRALIGPDGEADLRLVRVAPTDLRDDPARLVDEVRARSFFPGPRAVLVEGARDALAAAAGEALRDWQEGDATLVVTAGALASRSALRRLFEGHAAAAALAIYDDPPDRAEIDAMLAAADLTVGADAAPALAALAHELTPGDFRQTVERIGLYKIGDATPLTAAEVEALAPATVEAAVDDVVNAAAEADVSRLGPLMRRLEAQGATPVTVAIAAARHFRGLLAAASAADGPAAALARMRPPVWGARRDRMRRQATAWGAPRLGAAIGILVETDLRLRSASPAPAMPLMERTLIRLAMMARR